MPDTEATRTPGVTVRHVRAASRAELERRVLTLQPAHDALVAAAGDMMEMLNAHGGGLPEPILDAMHPLAGAIAAASEAGS